MADSKKKKPEEQRTAPRVDFFDRVKVHVPDDKTSLDLFASNVSEGGMFLRSNRPLPNGKKVALEFETKDGKVRVEEGEVVWTKPFDPISIDGSPPGMGVKFKAMSKDSNDRIQAFISDALGVQQPRPSPALTPSTIKTMQPPPLPKTAAAPAPPPAPRDLKPPPASPLPPPIPPVAETASPFLPPGPVSLAASMKLELHPTQDVPASGAKPPVSEPIAPNPAESEPAIIEEGEPEMVSTPPPRTRLFLFAGFVLVVAIATFFTLLVLKPFEISEQPGGGTVQPTGPIAATPDGGAVHPSDPGAKPTQAAVADAGAMAPPDEGPKPGPDAGGKTAEANTAPLVDAEVAVAPVKPPEAVTPGADAGTAAASDGSAGPPDAGKPPEGGNKPAPVAPPVTGVIEVNQPVFTEGTDGWTMQIKASAPVRIKYFPLKNPPRLAVDFENGSYPGKRLVIEAPAPVVSRVRVGKQEGFVRFVLDFGGADIPVYQATVAADSISILFKR